MEIKSTSQRSILFVEAGFGLLFISMGILPELAVQLTSWKGEVCLKKREIYLIEIY